VPVTFVSMYSRGSLIEGRTPGPGRRGGQCNRGFCSRTAPLDCVPVAQVGLIYGDVLGEAGDIRALDSWIVEVVEIVEDAQGVVFREQQVSEIGADEPGPAGEENFHRIMV